MTPVNRGNLLIPREQFSAFAFGENVRRLDLLEKGVEGRSLSQQKRAGGVEVSGSWRKQGQCVQLPQRRRHSNQRLRLQKRDNLHKIGNRNPILYAGVPDLG